MSNIILPRPSVLFLHSDHELARAIAFRLDLAGFTVEVLPARHDSYRPARDSYDAAIVQLPSQEARSHLAEVQQKNLTRNILVLAREEGPTEPNGVAAWLTAPISPRAIERKLRQLVEHSGHYCGVPHIRAAARDD
ncbi:MAG: hypothetical protein AB7K24_16845, partial [Gemmataceae bacterium]